VYKLAFYEHHTCDGPVVRTCPQRASTASAGSAAVDAFVAAPLRAINAPQIEQSGAFLIEDGI
jgi:hypothetical protein